MEISRIQEEILIVLHASDRPMYSAEITEKLNCDRPKGWKRISEQSAGKTISRMVDKGLIDLDRHDEKDYNKKYYKISDEGHWSLMQARSNRQRLGSLEQLSFITCELK